MSLSIQSELFPEEFHIGVESWIGAEVIQEKTDNVRNGVEAFMQAKDLSQLTLAQMKLTSLFPIQPHFPFAYVVRNVCLSANCLRVFPMPLLALKTVEVLNLSNNCLKALPGDMGQLQKLTKIYLDFNQFEAFPEGLIQLKQLTHLTLDGNQISVLPATIRALVHLKWLHMAGNQLTCMPEEIGDLNGLEWLKLRDNPDLNRLPQAIFSRKSCHIDVTNTSVPPNEGMHHNFNDFSPQQYE